MKILLYLFSLALAVADISLQTFSDDDCGGGGGTALQNVHANGQGTADASGCQSLGQFNSARVVSVDSGFQCNLYSDSSCGSFLETVSTVECTPVIGQGAICFNQAAFSNPFVESTSTVSVGQLAIQVFGGSSLQTQIDTAVNQACGSGTSCDPTNTLVLSQTIPPANPGACNEGLAQVDPKACASEDCKTTISMSGGFGSGDQRDYIKGLMQKALDTVPSPVSFVGVRVVDKNLAQQATMAVSASSQCTSVPPPSAFDCTDTLKDAVSGALALVPEVGGVLSTVFQVALCDSNSS